MPRSRRQTGPATTPLTTNLGVPLADNENSLRAGRRGPTLLEDFALREKIHHFDHERIPERVVHARGSGAHGYFELTTSLRHVTRARVLTDVGVRVPVFARFSTVVGGAGSADTPRDVRGFAVRFHTPEGLWDLVGNNIPVFFIQDAIKFPDLVHAVKMEADRGYPQAATAHDTFWDFVGLIPESTHMVLWAMSDRALPRSLRMMEGFGVHAFRLLDDEGRATFVKFHWRPVLGLQSTLWDEAVKLAGADPDYHRRDLFEAIAEGRPPAWDLGVQLLSDEEAAALPFDLLDPTKLVPEEHVPVQYIGRMVLDRNPENFFAETEQVAFLPTNLPPGIDVSDDPLLQGRTFSYLHTQLSRLGSPNWPQLPINQPRGCPVANFQRDGQMQRLVPTGRATYDPNGLGAAGEALGPRADSANGFRSRAAAVEGLTVRLRAESFADHYSQARMFYRSQSDVEQAHIVAALTLELSKVALPHVRARVLAALRTVEASLAARVAAGLGETHLPPAATPVVPVVDLPPSPALRLIEKYPPSLEGRAVGVLVTDGASAALVARLRRAVETAGARLTVVTPTIAGVVLTHGATLPGDGPLAGTPSVLFDAVAVVASIGGCEALLRDHAAVQFVADAYVHLKAISYSKHAAPLLEKAGVIADAFVVPLEGRVADFAAAAARRHWLRERVVWPER